MLDKEKMLSSMKKYFENTTKEKLIQDLKDTGSWDMVKAIVDPYLGIETQNFKNVEMKTKDSSVEFISNENSKRDYSTFVSKSLLVYANASIDSKKIIGNKMNEHYITLIGA